MFIPLRVLFRLVVFGLISVTAFVEFCLYGHWLPTPAKRRYQGRWLGRYSRLICRLLNIRITQIGQPSPAGLLIANHMSYIDPFVIASRVPVIFVAKHDIRDWPWGGILTRCGGTIYLNRTQRTDVGRIVDRIKERGDAGVAVGLFLEGTTSDGTRILPFHAGLLQPAIDNHWQVLPCAINYRVRETGSTEGVAWYGDTTFLPHLLQLLRYSRIEAVIEFAPALSGDNRKTFSTRLHQDISRMHDDARQRLGIPLAQHEKKGPSLEPIPPA